MLLFPGGCKQLMKDLMADFSDKTMKNLIVSPLYNAAKEIISFTISWVQSWDPVRCLNYINSSYSLLYINFDGRSF